MVYGIIYVVTILQVYQIVKIVENTVS